MYIIQREITYYLNNFKLIFEILLFSYVLINIAKKGIIIKSKKKQLNWNIINYEFLNLIHKYEHLIKNEKNISEDCPIWLMWYDGIQKAPPIIKACITSIKKNSGKHPVYILDKNNYYKYITLPSLILRKFHKRIFTITHFSDIIRMGLLSKYGGYWIDSTYFITSPFISVNSSLYTLKLSQCYPTIIIGKIIIHLLIIF